MVEKTEINQNHQDADARINIIVFAIDTSSENVGFPNETFLEEIKPANREMRRNMFSKIEMSRYKFQFLELRNFFVSDENLKINYFETKRCIRKYVFDCGFDQKNTCLTEKNKFDDGDQTVIVEVFEKFEELAFAEHMFSFFTTKTLCKLEAFSWDKACRNQSSSYREEIVWLWK